MALKDYYQDLENSSPRNLFRQRLIAECGVNVTTVFRWINGEVIPDKLKQEKISELTGIPVDELFPKEGGRS